MVFVVVGGLVGLGGAGGGEASGAEAAAVVASVVELDGSEFARSESRGSTSPGSVFFHTAHSGRWNSVLFVALMAFCSWGLSAEA